MERNHSTVNYSPPPTNPTTVPQRTAELVINGAGNRTTSVVQQQPLGLEHLAANLRGMKWTDEKHSLYLKSMEASFVNQLHDSNDTLGRLSSQKHVSKHNSSRQFEVFREGWRRKKNLRREEDELNKKDEATEFVEITSNPWIRSYRSECRQYTRTPASFEKNLEYPASDFESLEGTDQNFIDEDTRDERECELQSSAKRNSG